MRQMMMAALIASALGGFAQADEAKLNDAQIAHVAYTAGQIDIAAAEQALKKASSAEVIDFARTMARDHAAVNEQALALVKKLNVTPQDNPVSQSLTTQAEAELKTLDGLAGAAFDKAYIANEVKYHQLVNGALAGTLIPGAANTELKSLLESGLALFKEHQTHAEHLAASVQ